jgi:Ino eighty subunit 2
VTNEDGEDEVDLEDEDGLGEMMIVDEQPKPTMYRWVSRLEDVAPVSTSGDGVVGEGEAGMLVDGTGKGEAKEGERKMVITFSVPESLLPKPPPSASPSEDTAGVAKMDLDSGASIGVPHVSGASSAVPPVPGPGKGPGVCAIQGCTAARKYRFVKDWTVGACGMGHLKDLEGQWGVSNGGMGRASGVV